MASNGERKPPRPRIEMTSGAASPEEAAAVVVAIEQFLVETAPAPTSTAPVNPWQRAALIGGTSPEPGVASPWGEPRTWGSRASRNSG